MKKWIISDMDGTILSHENDIFKIDDYTIEKINEVVNNDNFEFTVATGRLCLDVIDIFNKHGIKNPHEGFVIGMNGAQIYSFKEKKLIKTYLLTSEQTKLIETVIEEIKKDANADLSVFGYNEVENEDKSIFFITDNSEKSLERFEAIIAYEGKGDSFKRHYYESASQVENVYKYVINFHNDIDVNQLVNKYKKLYPGLMFFKTGPRYIEIGRKDVSKLTAIEFVNDNYYKIDRKNIYVLGDSGNDLEMMSYTTNAITRFDTDEHIKSECNHIYNHKASTFVGHAIDDIVKGKI